MLVLLTLYMVTALAAPALVRWWGPRAFYLLAAAPAAAVAWAVAHTPAVRGGGAVVETYPWVPQLRLELALRMSTLSWLMLLLVGGVGALVLAYCARYFRADEPGLGRFAAVFVAFAGAMHGLVVADDLILLYIFWELTTVFSYLLIGQNTEKRASRRAAAQALIVTTLGGLAMLVGFIMLGEHAGTYRWSEIIAGELPGGAYLGVALVLILLGALAKSAIFPFSFWLPAAMAAPTPVSAYLHAAAMVKAGVYLVALLAPAFGGQPTWSLLAMVAGAVTMLFGGWAALRQSDLKLLLAYGTVSQLGLLVLVTGAGTRDAALAGAAMLLAHALFKAALFLIVGIIDRRAGTRDLHELSGLRRRMPGVAVTAALAAASMAGVPPLFGFVGKEAILQAFADDPAVLAAIVLGAVLTTAYSLRFLWGAFADKPGVEPTATRPVGVAFLAPPALLAGLGLLLGPLAGVVDRLLAPYPALFGATGAHLALWHGPTPALGLSLLALAGGALLFALRERLRPAQERLRAPVNGATVYGRLTHALDRLSVEVTGATQRGSLPQYLGIILLVLVVLPGGALLIGAPWPERVQWWDTPAQLLVGVVLAAAAVAAVRTQRRLAATVLAGVTGYGTALMFVLHGAPDLALTQFLVETLTIAVFVLVLRRLPAKFSARPLRSSRWLRVSIGIAVGLVMSGLALAAAGGRQAVPISVDFPEQAVSYGGGRNVVNVTLVDIRAWDTMGEIAVLVVAATGVASLIFLRPRTGPGPRRGEPPVRPPRPQPEWLRGGPALDTRRRSIIFEVVTRLLFHTMLVFSIYLMFSGHNAPGGGFAGGLVAGLALAVRYLAGGRHELDEAAPVDAGLVLGAGLFLSVGTGVTAMLFGGEVLQSAIVDLYLPLIGKVHVVTSLFFDVGVYLVVVGLALDVLRSLGAEVDRHIEADEQRPTADDVRQEELV
ncbi:multisubunit sodium/proton antiporter, MrpA subunit /multisubunit sodium/proton antiporter, MrpB subunit [Micromonospora pattaloongensis]|uniref:Multisubunit sodium/proton antiporter, MrpA subunit /multisubunit sodium/proton antiporter, MrpB subunit n=1 Tax=Micromonospora pattaloongensis TaxID=405436 RepID=A0A1H3KH04_9ACTN|nr:Na+/H+ antiporter subunit A [Micromonospora pattaloongensis]SDY50874.1 multisubunit sodium/proton antiporter, MrpA subunit /multisubunit sodium/proton antiporter, MrpB subunit [Micromonospora pattaloongensis]